MGCGHKRDWSLEEGTQSHARRVQSEKVSQGKRRSPWGLQGEIEVHCAEEDEKIGEGKQTVCAAGCHGPFL